MKKWQLREELDDAREEISRLRVAVQAYHEMYEESHMAYGRMVQLIEGQRDGQFIPIGSVRAALYGHDE